MEIPNWDDINFITTDLRFVLDAINPDEAEYTPNIRVKLARAIAQIRDDKIVMERALDMEGPYMARNSGESVVPLECPMVASMV